VPGSLTGDGKPFDFADPPPCEDHHDIDDTKVEVRSSARRSLCPLAQRRDSPRPAVPNPDSARRIRASDFDGRASTTRLTSSVQRTSARFSSAIALRHIGDARRRRARKPNARITSTQRGRSSSTRIPICTHARRSSAPAIRSISPSFRVVRSRLRAAALSRQFLAMRLRRGRAPEAWTTEWKEHRLRTFVSGRSSRSTSKCAMKAGRDSASTTTTRPRPRPGKRPATLSRRAHYGAMVVGPRLSV
jgi:hypothetical protein